MSTVRGTTGSLATFSAYTIDTSRCAPVAASMGSPRPYGSHQACPDGTDSDQRTRPQTLDLGCGIVDESAGRRHVAEVSCHPIEQSGRICTGQRRLSDTGNPNDIIASIAEFRKLHQRATYRRHSPRLTGPVREMAAHAAQLVIDQRLISPRYTRARAPENEGRECGQGRQERR
jgi:hypothetical protein